MDGWVEAGCGGVGGVALPTYSPVMRETLTARLDLAESSVEYSNAILVASPAPRSSPYLARSGKRHATVCTKAVIT